MSNILHINFNNEYDAPTLKESYKLFSANKNLGSYLIMYEGGPSYFKLRGLFDMLFYDTTPIFNNDTIEGLTYSGLLSRENITISPTDINYFFDLQCYAKNEKVDLLEYCRTNNFRIQYSITELDNILLCEYSKRKVRNILSISNLTYDALSRKAIFYSSSDSIKYHLKDFFERVGQIYKTIDTNYDPTKPFSIILQETITESRSDSATGSDSLTNDNTNSSDSVYGFSSSESKPVNASTSSRSYSSSSKDSSSGSRNNTRNYTRSGNIGNSSYSKLIEDERKKIMFDFKEYIINGIVDILCSATWCD